MRINGPPFDVRERASWTRVLVVVALILLPIAVIEWLWSFLPLRWQYGVIRDADPVIEAADRLSVRLGRPPTYDGLLRAVPDPLVADRLNYEPVGIGYHLTVVGGFDCSVSYDSHAHQWKSER